ncbi:MAG: hypothetical protein KBD66_00180 [Candidatus Doudnabacteria bacterium]|nr:hypothetical protein [Candidatus Doudnabacteria bacterium]
MISPEVSPAGQLPEKPEVIEQKVEHTDAAAIRQLIHEGNIRLPTATLEAIRDGEIIAVHEDREVSGRTVLVAYGGRMVVVVLRSSPVSDQHLLNAAEVITLHEGKRDFASITLGSSMATNPSALQKINETIAGFDARVNASVLPDERQAVAAEREAFINNSKQAVNQANLAPNVDKQELDRAVDVFLAKYGSEIPEYVKKALNVGRKIKLEEK